MIKLVISDMDGTLIGRDEILPNTAIELADQLREKGIQFTIATGRAECMAKYYADHLKIEIPYITCNGVTIIQGQRIIRRNQMPLKGLRQLFDRASNMWMSLVYSINGAEYVYKVTPWILKQRSEFDRYHDVHIFTEEEWETIYIDKLMIMDDVRTGAIELLEEMCRDLPPIYGFTRYTNKSVEVVNSNSTKASALKELVAILGIDMSEVMAIGDHQNDMEMIKEAGLGVAVGNATKELKEQADYVTKEDCFEGVKEAIYKFCLQNQ